MDTIAQLTKDIIEPRREIIRQSLDQIAADLESGLREAGLDFPVYMSVPISGESFLSYITPLDPNDADWERATELLVQIVSKRLNGASLITKSRACAVANSKVPLAAEIITATDD